MSDRLARFDYVLAGRLLGAGIIIGGIILAVFNASASTPVFGEGWHPKIRAFVDESLMYIWSGGLVLIVTELLARLRGDDWELPMDWNITDLVRVLGLVVIVAGTISAYGAWQASTGQQDVRFLTLSAPNNANAFRRFLSTELRTYLWQGGVLILLAAIVDRIGWPGGDDAQDEEPALTNADGIAG